MKEIPVNPPCSAVLDVGDADVFTASEPSGLITISIPLDDQADPAAHSSGWSRGPLVVLRGREARTNQPRTLRVADGTTGIKSMLLTSRNIAGVFRC